MRSLRIAPGLLPHDALAWLQEGNAGGAVAFVVTTAKGNGVRVTPTPEARARLDGSLERAQAATGASRVLAWHAEGEVPTGGAVAVVGACAEHRKDALRAVDLLLAGLQGVAERTDL